MTAEEWEIAMAQLPMITEILAEFPADEMLQALARGETYAAFLDPTLMQRYLSRDDIGRYLKPQLRAIASASVELRRLRGDAIAEALQ